MAFHPSGELFGVGGVLQLQRCLVHSGTVGAEVFAREEFGFDGIAGGIKLRVGGTELHGLAGLEQVALKPIRAVDEEVDGVAIYGLDLAGQALASNPRGHGVSLDFLHRVEAGVVGDKPHDAAVGFLRPGEVEAVAGFERGGIGALAVPEKLRVGGQREVA
ncbi:MAG: hypothetical protein ACKODH_08525 [Limisphaerales bacterium]